MNGQRLHEVEGEDDFVFRIFTSPGAYGKRDGVWYCCTPNGLAGNLCNHSVVEHNDGTITVSPSILVAQRHPISWHGYLKQGVWSEC